MLSNQEIEGDCYVIAAGAWSKELLKDLAYDSPILPARGLAMLFDTKGDKIIEAPALLEDLGIAVAQHDANTLRVSGFFEMVGFNDSFKTRKKQWMLDRAREHITKFSKLNLVQEGVGYRPCTPDQLPIIGQVPGIENAYVASGNCRLGVTLAPATARLIQGIIENEHEVNADKEFCKLFDPSRFAN